MWKKKKKNNHHIPLKLTLGTWTLASDQREAPPPAGGRRGRAVRLRASALLHMGVGEGDNLSVGAQQVDCAVGVALLLAAGARVHHRGGHLRVPGNEERGSSAKTPTTSPHLLELSAFGLLVRWRRQNELLRGESTAGSFTVGYINLVAGLAVLVCHLCEFGHLLAGLLLLHTFFFIFFFSFFFRWDTVSSAFVC